MQMPEIGFATEDNRREPCLARVHIVWNGRELNDGIGFFNLLEGSWHPLGGVLRSPPLASRVYAEKEREMKIGAAIIFVGSWVAVLAGLASMMP